MKSIAIYNSKGGVGKTTLAVNLAWASAALSARRTLLWDLDPQAAASFLLRGERKGAGDARAVFSYDVAPSKLIVSSPTERLDLLPADASLRGLDRFLFALGKKRRLEKLLEKLGKDYDRMVLDCPPGLTETSEQVLRAAQVIVIPLIPSPLSQRALADVLAFLDRNSLRRGAVLPVYNQVDRRRSMHRAALEAEPNWPVVPMSSAIEAMTARHQPVGAFAVGSPAARAFAELWRIIEKRLARMPKAG